MAIDDIKREMKEAGIKKGLKKKQKQAILITAIVLTGGLITIFTIAEIIRSQNRIVLATTTSTYDSGLLDYLIPTFEQQTGITVEILSVGTGMAIEIAQRGDADVLLVHSRAKEDLFVSEGYGIHRTCVMYNDFIVVGPTADPSGILGDNITDALTKLNASGELGNIKFYSRGDNSGTHNKELALWALIGLVPDPAVQTTWYFETGAGMGDTLTITDQNDGYTLIDRGTWLSAKDNVDLKLLVEGDEVMLNPYGAIAVNPALNSSIKFDKAKTFIAFLVSEQGQTLIGAYRKNNEILFHPAFGKCNETHSCTTTSSEVAFWKYHNGGYIGPASVSIESSYSAISELIWQTNLLKG